MSNGNVVPVSAFSSLSTTGYTSELFIGDKQYTPSVDPTQSVFWLSVFDLTNLNEVANDVSDGTDVPSDIAQYVGNSQYFLFALSSSAQSTQVPQGDLYTLLQKVGSGQGLVQLEQLISQLGTGFLGTFSYILGAAMDESVPGFETMSFFNFSLLTMGFLPITVDGNTIYAPVQAGT
jgi:hypothetical protein